MSTPSPVAVRDSIVPLPADDYRRRLLDAAEEVFAARGYRGATTREIANRAGLAKRMLFYYFPNKEALYRGVLDRWANNMIALHERFRGDPGPVGLAEVIEGITLYAAAHLAALKVVSREIMDGGAYLPELSRKLLQPLFARGHEEVARNMAGGVFRPGDPMHAMVSVGGVTLFYFLIQPLLALVWDRDPLAPETLAERAAAARDCIMYGLAGPAAHGGRPS
jgi:TetR/AcrR family transcriptional regulator